MRTLELFTIVISFFLIFLIFSRVPPKNVGLANFTTKISLGSIEHLLNISIGFCIIILIELAIKLNLS